MTELHTPSETLPDHSLAAVFSRTGEPLALQSFPLPELGPGEALVRVELCTVCGSDLHTVTGKRQEKVPTILGHEICGWVVANAAIPLTDLDGVALREGDRVTWSTSVSCGTCDRCQSGLPQKCRTLAKFGHEATTGGWPLSGGLTQYVHLKAGSRVARLPEGLPAEVACPANCATATVAAAFRVAGSLSDKRVLIFGAGMLGLTAAAMAKSLGARTVVVCDRDARRLSLASQFGADAVVTWTDNEAATLDELGSRSGGTGYDVLVELSGSPSAVEAACALTEIGAKVVLVGTVMKSRPIQIDPEALVRRWTSIHGVHNYTPEDLRTAVAFLAEQHTKFPFAELVAKRFPLDEINAAIDFAVTHGPVRIAIAP
ncbi:MAG: zinc-binding dehydrogenase [Planctomycetaceae bacterium]|nr:zinc-binding dehydrogenase [Planctomycetaceae bacterium]